MNFLWCECFWPQRHESASTVGTVVLLFSTDSLLENNPVPKPTWEQCAAGRPQRTYHVTSGPAWILSAAWLQWRVCPNTPTGLIYFATFKDALNSADEEELREGRGVRGGGSGELTCGFSVFHLASTEPGTEQHIEPQGWIVDDYL